MTEYRSDLLRVFQERGYIHQISDPAGLDEAAATGDVVTYVGYDCTADSLHIGHLVSIMMLRRLQESGHKPIVLMGGGTSRVGDPSFRDQQRPLLSDAAIAANKAAIKRSFANFLRFGDAPSDAAMADNAEWLDELRYIPFLREVGRHFSVSRMLTMDSVKSRLDRDQPYSFLEFNYMLLQSYDFVELAKRYGCRMQMGGSDQWGNIVMGVELGRRMADLSLFALTTPLITTASGEKMGKTAAGAVWLNPDRLSGHDYWQFWRNTEDADVGRFLKLFTDLPLAEIARLGALGGVEINEAKKILANEATALCRGAAAAERAAETARKVFEQGATGDDLPTLEVPRAALDAGLPLATALADAGLAASRGEARRLIQQGGVRVNDVPAGDPQAALRASDLDADGRIKLSAGRKRHALLRAV